MALASSQRPYNAPQQVSGAMTAYTPRASLVSAPTSVVDQQWLYTPREVDLPPSVRHGNYTIKSERQERSRAVKYLWDLRDSIAAPTLVVATAATFLHRFYMRESMQDWKPHHIATAAFFLSAKVEEHGRSLRSIVSVALSLKLGVPPLHSDGQTVRKYEDSEQRYVKLRNEVTRAEEAILRVLGFEMTVRLPYPAVVKGAKMMWKLPKEAETARDVARVAWCFVTDTLPTTLSLLHRPNIIASAAVLCACIQLGVPIPAVPEVPAETEEGEEPQEETYWLDLFDVDKEELQDAVKRMVDAYRFSKDSFVVDEAAKLAQRAIAAAELVAPRSKASSTPNAAVPAPAEGATESMPPTLQPPQARELEATVSYEALSVLNGPTTATSGVPASSSLSMLLDAPSQPATDASSAFEPTIVAMESDLPPIITQEGSHSAVQDAGATAQKRDRVDGTEEGAEGERKKARI